MTQREKEILDLIAQDPMIQQQTIADRLGITRSSVAVHISNLTRKGYIAGKGYVIRSGTYAAVVGGVNVDIGGRSFAPLVAADSNPGTVSITVGGVGRNIANNLALMGTEVRMLTAVGDDRNGQHALSHCLAQGMDMSNALVVPGAATSTYLYLTGPDGEMALAVSDMSVCQQVTPAYLAANLNVLRNARVVVADTNIPAESLAFLAENVTVPLFVDPVSTAKAEKLRPILHKIHTLKPNRMEAEFLSGVPIREKEDFPKAAKALRRMGVKRVFISLGADGVYAADEAGEVWLPTLPGKMVNTTGCGDAFMAALVWAEMEALDLEHTALAGLAAGSIAMESQLTINPEMNADAIRERMMR